MAMTGDSAQSNVEADQLSRVRTWTVNDEPYWNGVARAGSNAPGTGRLHRARIDDGRVRDIECNQRAESWVPFTATSTPTRDRHTCSRCGDLTRVPGVEDAEDSFLMVRLTGEYAPEEWSPSGLEVDNAE